jgi:glycerate dehydrogenase
VASAFGCDVVYASTQGAKRPESVTQVSMDELLNTSDIISIHSPLNEKTKSLIGDEQFAKMKKTAILLNLGRGGIVDEHAAANALKNGTVGAIGLDVLQSEPMDEKSPLTPFLKDERLFITPHIAWSSLEARRRLLSIVEQNIEGFLNSKPQNIVS